MMKGLREIAVLLCSAGYTLDAAAAALFYIVSEKTGNSSLDDAQCSGYTVELPSLAKKKLFTTVGCPQNIILHNEFIYFSKNSKLFSKRIDADASTEKLIGTLPAEDTHLWIDKGSGRIRGSYVIPIEESLISHDKEQNALFTYENKKYSVFGFGTVGMAIGVELNNGTWKKFEQKATTDGACDALGIRALESVPESSAGTNVSHPVDDFRKRRKDAESHVKKTLNQPELSKLELTDKKSAYFKIWDADGKVGGPEAPVYLCDNPCRKLKKLRGRAGTPVLISAKENYLLLKGENGLSVYSLENGKIKLKIPDVSQAVWVQ